LNSRVLLIRTVDEVPRSAALAIPAIATEEADTHALVDVPAVYVFAQSVDPSDCLVARDFRIFDREWRSVDRGCVGMTDTARLYADADVASGGLSEQLLREFEATRAHYLYSAIS
jgi:hypothetical protein